jgi:hypothetical protein
MKKNPLLARPPHHLHRLRDESRIADVEDPYLGVHTSGTWNIAAAYAMSAWRQNSRYGYPVVVTLDVTGLKALPDVDALLRADDSLSYMRNEVKEALDEGVDIWNLAEQWYERDYERVYTPEGAVFQEHQEALNPISAAIDLYDDDAEAVLLDWAEGGVLPGDVLSHLIDQRRYLVDFPLSRVVRIETFRPWYDSLVEDYWGEEDRPSEAVQAEKEGYQVVFYEDIYESGADFNSERVTLYEGTPSNNVQYHGSWSGMIQMAFPQLNLPDEYWGIEPE